VADHSAQSDPCPGCIDIRSFRLGPDALKFSDISEAEYNIDRHQGGLRKDSTFQA
jgi:hypothetical protein